MKSIPILLALLFLDVANTQNNDDEVDKVANVVMNKGNGTGPDKKYIAGVLDRMQSAKLRSTNFGRQGTAGGSSDLTKQYQALRKTCGPKSNQTTSSNGETHEALKNFALQGDMIVSPEQLDDIIKNDGRTKRGATTDASYYWNPNVPIPYEIDSSLNKIKSQIQAGIQFWQEHSCLTFVENPYANNRLRYYYGQGCWSYVGKQTAWASQDISIGDGCTSLGTICHETMHALGFYHTQSNPDRDTYINIYKDNIQPNLQYNFDKMPAQSNDIMGISYDYGSVMQYPPYAFAVDPNVPTTMSKDANYQNLMGQRDGPAFSDIKQLNTLYKCADRCGKAVACQNNGIVNSKTCNSCICPKYFAGRTCNMLPQGSAPICNGQTIQATSTSWQTTTLSFGNGMTYQYAAADVDCYWLIQAPIGYKIQIQMQSVDTTCMESCPWCGYEINMGNLDQCGMKICCQSFSGYTYTSQSNLVPIRGTCRYNNGNMELRYRVVY